MAATTAAEHLFPLAEEAVVRSGDQVLGGDRRCKARPAGVGIMVVSRPVQIEPAGGTTVKAMLAPCFFSMGMGRQVVMFVLIDAVKYLS